MILETSPEVFGVYLNNEPVNVVRANDHVRIVAQQDDRIVALQNLNEGKAATIQDLREEVERARRSEGIEVQKTTALKRKFRDDIALWADENDLDREFVNGLLESLGLELLPEYVEAEIEVRVTVRFEAGAGTPTNPSSDWLNDQIELGSVEVRPAWGSSLTVEEISTDSHDVIGVVAH